jgi:hypothetical protein
VPNLNSYSTAPPLEEEVPPPAVASEPAPAASPPPAEAAPAAVPEDRATRNSLNAYSAPAPAATEPASPTEPAPQQQSSNPLLGPAHAIGNALVPALTGAGDFIGDRVEDVGGKGLRDTLAGFAPPIQEIADANSPLDMAIAASDFWDRPAQSSQQRMAEKAVEGGGSEPYNLTSPEGIGTALGQFGEQIGDYIQHPEHILQAIPDDTAEGTAVFGEQGFNDWVAANPEAQAQYGTDDNALYQAYLADIGYTPQTGGLSGFGKGIVQQSLTDPTMLPALIATGGLSAAAKSAANAGKTGVARGLLTTQKATNVGLGGPEELLLDAGGSVLTNLVRKIPGVGKIFAPSDATARQMQTQAVQEIAAGTTTDRGEAMRAAQAQAQAAGTAPSAVGSTPGVVTTPNGATGTAPATGVATAAPTITAPSSTGSLPARALDSQITLDPDLARRANGTTDRHTMGGPVTMDEAVRLQQNRNAAQGRRDAYQAEIGRQNRPVNITMGSSTPGVPIGGRATTPNGATATPSSRRWEFDPAHRAWTVDGELPTEADLRAAADEWVQMPPRTIKGYEDGELFGRMFTDPTYKSPVRMRATLTQGTVDPVTRAKTPFMVDDVPLGRMANQSGVIDPTRAQAGARYIRRAAQRVQQHGQDEVEYLLSKLNQDKYRGVLGNSQPFEIWWDNKRQVVLDALRTAQWQGPVDLGLRHKLDATTGMYVPDPGRRLVLNDTAPGQPLKLEDFEPDLGTWQALQASAQAQGNNPALRITTPPPVAVHAPQTAQNAPLFQPTPTTQQAAQGAAQTVNQAARPTTPTSNPGRPQTTHPALPAAPPSDEFNGLRIPDGYQPTLRMPVKGKRLFDVITESQDDVHAILDGRAAPEVVARYEKHFTDIYAQEPNLGSLTPEQGDLFAADVATKIFHDSLPKIKQQHTGLLGKVGQISGEVASFRSAMGLYNWMAAPRQLVVQHTGNVFTLLLTKPGAITKMFDPRTAKAYYDAAKAARKGAGPGARVRSAAQTSAAKMGLPENAMITGTDKRLVSTGTPSSGLGKAAQRLFAPEWLKDIVAIPDAMLRDATMATDFTPGVRKLQGEYGTQATLLAQDWTRTKGLRIPPGQVKSVIDNAFRAHYSTQNRYSEITALELETALKKAFPTAPEQGILGTFANRVARDYKTQLNTIYQQAARETRRIGFSWDPTVADDVARHVILYHYWSSRMGGLYTKTLLSNPWMAANFARMAQAAHEEAQEMGYPAWMQGFTRLLSSPGGSVLFANPFSLFATALTFADWQYGMEPEKLGQDLTALGRARGIVPFMLNPLWESAAWALGLFGGEDARAVNDPTGLERMVRDPVRLINLATLNGHTGDFFRDEAGNPVLLSEKPLTELVTKFASALGGVVREDAQPIPNLYATQTTNTQSNLMDLLVTEHPDWDENLITREFSRITSAVEAGETADPLWIEAQKLTLEQQVRGPEFAQLPEGLRGLVGGVIRNVSPMAIYSSPEMTQALRNPQVGVPGRPMQDLPAMGDEYDGMDMRSAIYDTPGMTRFGVANEDWYGDSALQAADDRYYRIGVDGGSSEGETINGVSYTQEQIQGMTDDRRWKLAREALQEDGFTPADLEARGEMQRAMEEGNPDLAAFKGYQDRLQSAGTPEERARIVDELYESEPAFARMMDQSPYPKGSPEWYEKAADWPETFYGATGERTSNYDPVSPLPDGMDTGMLQVERAESRAAQEERAASSYIGQRERSVNEFMLAQDLLDQQYPDYGLQVGAGNLPYEVWTAMKPVWEEAGIDTRFITKSNHYGAEYVNWLRANPGLEDTSLQAFLDATMLDDGSNKFADDPALATGTEEAQQTQQQAPIDLDAPLDMARLAQRFGLASAPAGGGVQLARPSAELDLRQSPGGTSIMRMPPGLVLRVLAIDGDWAHVATPGGYAGYVPTSYLKTA